MLVWLDLAAGARAMLSQMIHWTSGEFSLGEQLGDNILCKQLGDGPTTQDSPSRSTTMSIIHNDKQKGRGNSNEASDDSWRSVATSGANW